MSSTPNTFNMKDLSRDFAQEFGHSQQSGAEIVEFMFTRVKAALARGQQVRLHQFGTLGARMRKAGVARNIKTGQALHVPAHRVVKFKPSPALEQLL